MPRFHTQYPVHGRRRCVQRQRAVGQARHDATEVSPESRRDDTSQQTSFGATSSHVLRCKTTAASDAALLREAEGIGAGDNLDAVGADLGEDLLDALAVGIPLG